MNGYTAEWEKGVVADHRKELQQRMGECLADATNLVLVSNGYIPDKITDRDKAVHNLAPIIGDIAHAMFMQRSSHMHFYIQKRKREDADKILKEKGKPGRID